MLEEIKKDYQEFLLDTDYIEQEVRFLLGGDYGYEWYEKAKQVLANNRMNKVAWVSLSIAKVVFPELSNAQARGVYLSLTRAEQDTANETIDELIYEFQELYKEGV